MGQPRPHTALEALDVMITLSSLLEKVKYCTCTVLYDTGLQRPPLLSTNSTLQIVAKL